MYSRGARYLNIAAGIWLFISAFVWQHSQAQFTNAWIMGIVVTVVALIGLSVPSFRWVNTIAGAWLIISGFALPRVTSGTVLNNVIVGLVVVAASLIPTFAERSHLRRVAA